MNNVLIDENGRSFLIGDYIGKGSFSQVYTLECRLSRRQFAGKFISKAKLHKYGISNKVWDEIKIHKMLKHKNIVQFLTYIEQQSHIIIVLEYCSRYSMVNVLHALKTLTLGEAKYFMIQIVSAVEYLHSKHIVHRDLKLGNLFLNKQLEIKLGDFGLAVVIEYEGQKRFSRCGTPNYIAPEVINGIGYSYEVDIWALGCILHTMLEGTPPFQGTNTTTTYNNILRGEYRSSPHIDNSAKVLILSSLQVVSKYRPTIFQLTKSEFFISSQIYPQPPPFKFGEDERLSLFEKRRKVSIETNVTNIVTLKQPGTKGLSNSGFATLSKCLWNIKKWTESTFGECLAEASSIKPLVWVNSWMDYTNSYGFAYQLSDENFGIIFNDHTRMLLQSAQQSVHYVQKDGTTLVCQMNSIPATLKKKFKILISCGTYMSESLLQAHEAKLTEITTKETISSTEVFNWTRSEGEVVMYLTNGSLQVNFGSDHTKLILCGLTKTVTVIERFNYMKTMKLDVLQKCGCSKTLKRKLLFLVKYINPCCQ